MTDKQKQEGPVIRLKSQVGPLTIKLTIPEHDLATDEHILELTLNDLTQILAVTTVHPGLQVQLFADFRSLNDHIFEVIEQTAKEEGVGSETV
jgi:hypothetical protein